MVVDVAANLQKELDKTVSNRDSWEKEAHRLIERLTDCANIIEHLEVTNKQQKTTIEEQKDRNFDDLKELYDLYEAELRCIKADRTSIKSDHDIMFQNYRNTVAKLREDIRGLEVELSVRKGDSEVLMKVVEIVKEWKTLSAMVPTYDMRHLRDLVKDYFGAPEGPPEPPIDESQEITVTVALLELP
jgi:predicted ribosome quality control (RQC) complex YloA/Tae2 family protein